MYLKQIHHVLPRLLALYDTDSLKPTFGMGDRYRWAWKLIDFGNGTFQGAAHGLARLLVHGLLPEWATEKSILRRIDAMFQGAQFLRYPNGSMVEAFPFESSFCVTALVAYDLLSAIELLENRLEPQVRESYLGTVKPMIEFLHRADETHAFISNHLATAVIALYKWTAVTGLPGEKRGKNFLDRILREQSEEGWFREYEGADPGYQSLCTYYLADLHRLRPDLGLLEPLRQSIRFLWHFAHPDGSFGGVYGSRNTRFFYPPGIETLGNEVPEALVLAEFMRQSINKRSVVTLEVMDEPNLIPMFNAYCWAAALVKEQSLKKDQTKRADLTLPSLSSNQWRKQFKQAGLFIDNGEEHYTILSYHKGGVCYHFTPQKTVINTGVVVEAQNKKKYSSQAYYEENLLELNEHTISIVAPLTEIHHQIPNPQKMMVLRILNLTLMRSLIVGNWIKQALVHLLITGKKSINLGNKRTIQLGKNLTISDERVGHTKGIKRIEVMHPFVAIHMASQGYWQVQDEQLEGKT
jgi:hypothetical protein